MGRIFDIKRFAIHDGPGIRTTVFLKGCPLDCPWCHNPESQAAGPEVVFRVTRCVRCGGCVDVCEGRALTQTDDGLVRDAASCVFCGKCAEACSSDAREIAGRESSVEKVIDEIAKDRVFYDLSGGGATFSGGEPLDQPDFLFALLDACAVEGIATAVDTCGFAPAGVMGKLVGRTGLFLYDLKLIDDGRHRDFCGVSNVPILENLRFLSEAGSDIVVRVPIIPGFNDGAGDVDSLCEFLSSLPRSHPVDLLPYERVGVDKYPRLGRVSALTETASLPAERVAAVLRKVESIMPVVTVRGEKI
jgi:pyruvate formate lyase activating enzyme